MMPSDSHRIPRIPTADEEPCERSPLLTSHRLRSPDKSSSQNVAFNYQCVTRTAIVTLCIGILAVILIGFYGPVAAQNYVQEAGIPELTHLNVDPFSEDSLIVSVGWSLRIDASLVEGYFTRMLGRFGGRLLGKVEIHQLDMKVYLPDFADSCLMAVLVPPFRVDIVNGHRTVLEHTVEVKPGPVENITDTLHDIIDGNVSLIRVQVVSNLNLKSGLLGLGIRHITKQIVLSDIPQIPEYKVSDITLRDLKIGDQNVVRANARLSVAYNYPSQFDIPSLKFVALITGCERNTFLTLATIIMPPISVKQNCDIKIPISAILTPFSAVLTEPCNGSSMSPLDKFIQRYLKGHRKILFVRGEGSSNDLQTPTWIIEFLKNLSVPVSLPVYHLDGVFQSLGISNIEIELPELDAYRNTPDSIPRLSATVDAVIPVPIDLQMSFQVNKVRARINVSYKDTQFGVLEPNSWMPTSIEKIRNGTYLLIQLNVKRAPLNVSDYSIVRRIVQNVLSGNQDFELMLAGSADIDVSTGLGNFLAHDLPMSGNISVNGLPDFDSIVLPTTKDIRVIDTTESSMVFGIVVTVTNPTPWKFNIPNCSLLIVSNNITLGTIIIEKQRIMDQNADISLKFIWNPQGDEAIGLGTKLIGEYISGNNVTITIMVYQHSLPSMPELSRRLSGIQVTLPMPEMPSRVVNLVNNGPDGSGITGSVTRHFITKATMHLLSSTADFVLLNPFPHDSITITSLNGSALYNGSILGTMDFTDPFKVNPGNSGGTLTPRIPVEWSIGGVGYEAMRKALGGALKILPQAHCTLFIGEYHMTVFFNATNSVAAHVKI